MEKRRKTELIVELYNKIRKKGKMRMIIHEKLAHLSKKEIIELMDK